MSETTVTSGRTKSGTMVAIAGGKDIQRHKAFDIFIKIYNRDFSTSEQKDIGNLLYELKSSRQNIPGYKAGEYFAGSNIELGNKWVSQIPKFGIQKRLPYVVFTEKSSNNEFAIVHELVHIRRFKQDMKNNRIVTTRETKAEKEIHQEKKVDFETVGRISKLGLDKAISPKTPFVGTYFQFSGGHTHSGNPYLIKSKLPKEDKKKIAISGLLDDRKLLTGSLNNHIVGIPAVKKSNELFPQSFLNQKVLNTNITLNLNKRK